MNANLYDLFERHFPDEPEQTFLIVPGGSPVSYGDLAAMSARMAHALTAAGCTPGDRVAAQVDKHWHVLALYLACLRAGLVYLPLNTAYQKSELAYFFADAKPRVIVCNNDRLGVVAALGGDATVLTIEEAVDRAGSREASFAPVQRAPDDLATILYTSGTTGRSKGAMITHRNLASNATTLVDAWGFTRRDVLLHALPIYHVHGLFVATHCALLAGARMVWLPKFDAHEVASLLPRATVMMGVPTFYTRLLSESAFTRERCASIRLFVSGSAPLLAETFDAFRERSGQDILERYGMTEAGMITSNPLAGPRVGGTVGRPLHGIDVRIVDERGEAAGPGVVGAVQVRGPNVFAGYWQMPDKTREEFTEDGYFKTGDVGEWVADGPARGYLQLVGRAKDVIICGGLNVYPKEIEERIDQMEGVLESAVVAMPDADFGEVVAAFVVRKAGCSLSDTDIIRRLKSEIAGFKVPKRVVFEDALPRNTMGKVQKAALRERLAAGKA
jgi:malonyl-CoA/methylmalonyl-CoA synthetase